MKKSRMTWTIKRLFKEVNGKTVSFDYPIQRAGGQWDDLQKSLLIHSIACDYPVPPLYALAQEELVGEGEKAKNTLVYYLLDGKQRTTNISDFINGEYRLDVNTPVFEVNGVEYDVAGYSFEELHEDIQDAINEFTLDIFKIDEATDCEIESMFFRLNNGTPLTSTQKAKANMGNETALKFKVITNHKVVKENAVFTTLQKKEAQDEVALFQAMMLLDENYKVGKFGNVEVFDYASSLRNSTDELFAETTKTLDYLSETLGANIEKVLLKKLHLPMVVLASNIAMNNNIPTAFFAKFLEDFKAKISDKTNNVTLNGMPNENVWLYKVGCGAGATKAEKVAERVHATKVEVEAFMKTIDDSVKVPFAPQVKVETEPASDSKEDKQDKKNKRANRANKNSEPKQEPTGEGQTEGQTEGQEPKQELNEGQSSDSQEQVVVTE